MTDCSETFQVLGRQFTVFMLQLNAVLARRTEKADLSDAKFAGLSEKARLDAELLAVRPTF